eukprot:g18846.t1
MGPWNGTPKYDLHRVAEACYQGDLDVLDMLLFSGDAENKFPGDINMHVQFQGRTVMTPLMLACQTGQIECVQLMISAKADPHMKCRVPFGKESSEGETAKESDRSRLENWRGFSELQSDLDRVVQDIALKHGWDDIVQVLDKALKDIPPAKYVRYGKENNSRYTVYQSGETGSGKDPFEEIKKLTKGKMPSALPASMEAIGGAPMPTGPTSIGLLFPGQGSQYVKMMDSLQDNVKVKEMIATARAVLGYDILEAGICHKAGQSTEGTTLEVQDLSLPHQVNSESLPVASRPEGADSTGAAGVAAVTGATTAVLPTASAKKKIRDAKLVPKHIMEVKVQHHKIDKSRLQELFVESGPESKQKEAKEMPDYRINPEYVPEDAPWRRVTWATLVTVCSLTAFLSLAALVLSLLLQLKSYLIFEWGECIRRQCDNAGEKWGFSAVLVDIAVDILMALVFVVGLGEACKALSFQLARLWNFKKMRRRIHVQTLISLCIEVMAKVGLFALLAFSFLPSWSEVSVNGSTELPEVVCKGNIDYDLCRAVGSCDASGDPYCCSGTLSCARQLLPFSARRSLFENWLVGPFVVAPFVDFIPAVLAPLLTEHLADLADAGATRRCGKCCCFFCGWLARFLAFIFVLDGEVTGIRYVCLGSTFGRPTPFHTDAQDDEGQGEAVDYLAGALDQAVLRPFDAMEELKELKLNFFFVLLFAPLKPILVLPTLLARLIEVRAKLQKLFMVKRRNIPRDARLVCLTGPEDKLEETSVCQPAMFLAGMAGLEKLRDSRPEAVERPGAVAGLSLGEYTALCAAGVFTFEQGMELVKIRGAAMAEAAQSRPQAMLSVAGLEQQKLEEICREQAKGGEVCQIANILFPKGFSCVQSSPLLLARLEIDGSPRFRPAPQTPRASHRTSARWTGVAWSLAAACAGRCAGHRAVVRRSGAVEVPEQTRSTGTTAAEARRAAARRSFREVATSTPVEREETWHLPADAPKALQALRGTYYLNGLASCDQGGRLVHPFEAHGFLRSFQFHGDGSITYRGRLVYASSTYVSDAEDFLGTKLVFHEYNEEGQLVGETWRASYEGKREVLAGQEGLQISVENDEPKQVAVKGSQSDTPAEVEAPPAAKVEESEGPEQVVMVKDSESETSAKIEASSAEKVEGHKAPDFLDLNPPLVRRQEQWGTLGDDDEKDEKAQPKRKARKSKEAEKSEEVEAEEPQPKRKARKPKEAEKSEEVEAEEPQPKRKARKSKEAEKSEEVEAEEPQPKRKARKSEVEDEKLQPKRKARKSKEAEKDEVEAEELQPKRKNRKSKEAKKGEEAEDEELQPRRKPRKSKEAEKGEEVEAEEPQPKRKPRKSKEAEKNEEVETEEPQPKRKARKSKEAEKGEEAEAEEPQPKRKPRKSKEAEKDEEVETEEPQPKRKARKSKEAEKSEEVEAEETQPKRKARKSKEAEKSEEVEAEEPQPKRKARKSKEAEKGEEAEEGEVEPKRKKAISKEAEKGEEGDGEGATPSSRTLSSVFFRPCDEVVHDWILTENYYVVPKNPARFHPPGLFAFLSGVAQGTEVFRMAEERELGNQTHGAVAVEVKEIPLDRFFNIFHMGPTYEEEKLMVVHCSFGGKWPNREENDREDFDPIGWSASATNPPPRLHRLQLDLEGNQMLERTQVPLRDKPLWRQDVPVDMPTFHPLRDGLKVAARYCYFSGAWRPEGWFPFRSLLKADLQSGEVTNWDAGDGCLVSEPLFLPNSPGATEWLGEEQEDDGWLASVVHDGDAERCRLVLLDARRVQEGPVKLKEAAEKAGAMQAKLLKTSGGFHTDLMKPAQAKLEATLQRLLPSMKPPRCDVYMNFTGKKIKAGTPPAEIVPLLAQQLCSAPAARKQDGLTEFYEVGPMKQLKAMMKRIDQGAWSSTTNVDV